MTDAEFNGLIENAREAAGTIKNLVGDGFTAMFIIDSLGTAIRSQSWNEVALVYVWLRELQD